MLGTLPFPGQAQGGERLLSQVVTRAIAALFRHTEQLEATVRVEPMAKLLQGSVDGFELIGKGMLMYNGLRLEAMELYLQAVAIDFGGILRGQVTLRQPTQATLRVVLTEADLTASFNTPFVVEKLQRLQYEGKSLRFRETRMTIDGETKSLRLQMQIQVGEATEPLTVDLSTQLAVEDRRKVQFVEVDYRGEPAAIALGQALIDHVNQLLDLDRFALDGTQLRVDRARIQRDGIVFYGTARIEHFPQSQRQAA
ncbi:LmeA family phospholipid-binding protein [Trichothermofontia sp.]